MSLKISASFLLRDLPAPAVSLRVQKSPAGPDSGITAPVYCGYLNWSQWLEEKWTTVQATICAAEVCKPKKLSSSQIFVVEGQKHETWSHGLVRFNGRSALRHFWCQTLPNSDFITDMAVLGVCSQVPNTRHRWGLSQLLNRGLRKFQFRTSPPGHAKSFLTLKLFRQELSRLPMARLGWTCIDSMIPVASCNIYHDSWPEAKLLGTSCTWKIDSL